MNPPEDTLQDIATSNEALLLHSLESEKTLKSIDTGLDTNAVATQQNTESIKDVEGAVEARIAQAENHKNEMMPSIEAIGKAMTFASALLEKLEGPQGPKGDKGDKGDTGEKGEKGEDAHMKGEPGRDGKDGIDGKDGTNGKDGRDGRDGVDGINGKDGAITKVDYKKIVAEVVKKIPEVNIDEKVKEIVEKVSINTNDTIQSIRTQKLASQSVSMGDLTDTKTATTGQTMVKQSDGTWRPVTSGGSGIVQTIVAGTNVTVDSTDPANPIVNATGGSGVSDGDKGDIVVSGSGTVWTIDTNAVVNADLAQMATKTYKGRTSASTGNAEDVPVATLKTDLSLNNVDNTSDANKPVSTAQQTALNLKANLASPTFTGTVTVPTPANDTDAATKLYVDAIAQGLSVKEAVLLATTAALPTNTYSNGASGVGATLTAIAVGVLTIDGTTVALNDRVLIKDEATQARNGIYVCTVAGTAGVAYVLTRSTNMDTTGEFSGSFCFVEAGTTNADAGFVCTSNDPITVGTTAITFTQFSGAGQITVDSTLVKTGNQIKRAPITGDVTITDGSNASAIANSAVTLAKMANLAQDQFIGRVTASTGVPETATITAAARTVLDDTTVSAMVDTLGGATATGTGGLVRRTSPDFTTGATIGSVAIPTISSTSTFTNKRIQPRTASSTTASNLSPDLSTANVYFRTTQTATLTIDAPTGTPVIGETIMIYVDSAGAQTLTINATYVAFGAAFPATTTAGKTFMMSAQFNGTNWKTLWSNAI